MVKLANSICVITIVMFSMTSCKNECKPKALVATKKVEVYKSHEGDSLELKFTLSPGDVCAVGNKKIEKTFTYLEVVCPGKGYGWVALGDDYIIIDPKNAVSRETWRTKGNTHKIISLEH